MVASKNDEVLCAENSVFDKLYDMLGNISSVFHKNKSPLVYIDSIEIINDASLDIDKQNIDEQSKIQKDFVEIQKREEKELNEADYYDKLEVSKKFFIERQKYLQDFEEDKLIKHKSKESIDYVSMYKNWSDRVELNKESSSLGYSIF
jgi:hypothetical protein